MRGVALNSGMKDDEPAEFDEQWAAESERRIAAFEAGKMSGDDAEAVYARLDPKFVPPSWHGEVHRERKTQYEAGEIRASDWADAQARIRKSVEGSE